jgi:hypothetical protein
LPLTTRPVEAGLPGKRVLVELAFPARDAVLDRMISTSSSSRTGMVALSSLIPRLRRSKIFHPKHAEAANLAQSVTRTARANTPHTVTPQVDRDSIFLPPRPAQAPCGSEKCTKQSGTASFSTPTEFASAPKCTKLNSGEPTRSPSKPRGRTFTPNL